MPYAPPANQIGTPGQSHAPTVYYEALGLDKLKPKLRFIQVCDKSPMPRNKGRTKQWYRFDVAGLNTVPVVDGVIGTPIPLASSTLSSTVEEYNDFTSDSRLVEETDLAPFVEEMIDFISTRGARSADRLARIEIDSNTAALIATEGAYFSVADIRGNIADMKGNNVLPFDGMNWMAIVHPQVTFDLMSDNTAGGFIDVLRYAEPARMLNGEVGKVAGTTIVETTEVGTAGTAPNVLYNSYLHGKGGIAMVDLAGVGPDNITDPNNEYFSTKVSSSSAAGSPYDPTGTLGTFVGYRFVTAFKTMDTTNLRFRIVQADASRV